MKTSTNVVGRRLRRALGALLAAGFGVTWWSFVPPVAAAVIRPVPASAMAAESVELHWSQIAMEPAPPPPIREPRVHRPDATPIRIPGLETPTLDPIAVPEPELVDDFPAIRTRSSR
jgi:hypothetical protein